MKLLLTNPQSRFPGIDLYVVVGTKRCRKACATMDLPYIGDKAAAWTSSEVGSNEVLMCFSDEFLSYDDIDKNALIAHECVHAAQMWCDRMIENEPGDEEFAYMVQCCFYSAYEGIKECLRKMDKKNQKGGKK